MANAKKKISTPPKPRPLSEIEAAYERASSDAGKIQYQLYIYEKQLENVNQELLSLNREAAAAKAEAVRNTKPEEVINVQS